MNEVSFTRVVILAGITALTVLLTGAETGWAAGGEEPTPGKVGAAQAETSRIVGAANAFLATLGDKQRARVLYRFDDEKQRARWSNFPTAMVPRGGISLREMNEGQRAAAMTLLAAALSPRGLEKVRQIMEADEAFKTTDHPHPPFGQDGGKDHGPPPFGAGNGPGGPRPPFGGPGPGGGNDAMLFGRDLYYVSILGTPSEKNPWMLQFGGHHLALNLTVAREHGVLTPTLTGAQPASFIVNGQTVRPLGPENDKAFALLSALDETQRQQAVLKYQVGDLVLGPGHDGQTILPEGLKVSAMNETQRAMLLDLISQWAGIVNERHAAARMEELRAGLDDTWFAWSGPTSVEPGKNGTAYYRIQGPKLVIEYAPQHEADHVHTMYRDPTNDYGRALTAPAP